MYLYRRYCENVRKMSKKRPSSTNLNHDNWDQEEPKEEEDMGTISVASDEVLEKRVFRTAKRRIQASGDGAKKGVFSGFGGFNKPPVTSFDFLANLTNGSNTNGGTKSDTAVTSSLFSSKDTSGGLFGTSSFSGTAQNSSQFASTGPKTEIPSMTFSSSKADSTVGDSPFKMHSVSSSADSNSKPSASQVTSTIFGVSSTSPNQKSPLTNTMFKQPVSSTSTQVQNSAPLVSQSKTEAKFDKEGEIDKARTKYYSRLKGLNESVSSWIVKHVEKTPLCFLSPIFKDYENYLKEIQEEYEAAKVEIEAQAIKEISEVKPVFGSKDSGTSVFTNKPSGSTSTSDVKPTSQSFGINPTPQLASNTNTTANEGLFGQKPASSIPQTLTKSKATLAKGFSFGATSTTNSTPTLSTNASTGTSPSQGFSFGIKPSTASGNPVSPPSKGFSFGVTPASNESSAFAATNTNAGSPNKGFSFGMTSTAASTSPVNSLFTAGATNTGSSPFKGAQFGTSVPPATSPTNSMQGSAIGAAPFSFGIGSGTPFSFSPQTQQQQQSTATQNEQDEDQPPKVEFTPVVEENSVYEKKCKIFIKKDGNFVDKGVGTLYVKKVEESGKHQLLVRANTNLGAVLLNMILASAVPTQRMGKNNVMLVCIPTPDAKPPPTPILIRVKTGEEADELLETLNKYKS